jgi:hypothetical protein
MPKQQQLVIAALLALACAVPASKAQGPAAQSPAQNKPPAAAPAAVGALDPTAEARRKENEEKLARAVAEEEKRIAAIKAHEQEQAERQKQLAKEKEARDAVRARAVYESQCQFKSVMTDEEIARCRSVHSN